MSSIFEVRAEGEYVYSFGARRTRREAEALLSESEGRAPPALGPAPRLTIVEIDITGLFQVPPRPTPRERYTTRVTPVEEVLPGGRRYTRAVHVDVLDGDRVVMDYHRNYAMLQTFEPFRQGGRDFALISSDYTATSVVDLATGEIIASEPHDAGGFCPVGFYVPDWWDVNDRLEAEGVLPGSMRWQPHYEWPTGDFGFVWGCHWGDDSTWKVQYLDLSRVRNGVLGRDDRFGYVELASQPSLPAKDFIECWPDTREVRFAVLKSFDLVTGRPTDDDDQETP